MVAMANEQTLETADAELRPEARLGIALRRARQSRGMSLRALATRLYRSHSNLVEYERGHRLAPRDAVEAYEAELGVAPGTLVALHTKARLELYGEESLRPSASFRPEFLAPHHLPPGVAHFTGRETELKAFHTLFAEGRPGTTMVGVIAGKAGVGKTAFAVHLAHKLTQRFPDAQLYVDLQGYEPLQCLTPAQVLLRFLRSLGVAAVALPAHIDEQVMLYRSLLADRRSLVVVENASSANQIRPLLPGGPGSMVLVTSRHRLAGLIAGEGARLFSLDVLSCEESLELLGRIAGVERLEAEKGAAEDIAKLCGYLPLALSIAATRLVIKPNMSFARLARRLVDERHRLQELAAGDVEVRASFARSYRVLSPAQACLFRRLSLIESPDFTLGMAAALMDMGAEAAEELLEALVDAHLLETASTPGRYRFHDLLRLYARERHETDAHSCLQGPSPPPPQRDGSQPFCRLQAAGWCDLESRAALPRSPLAWPSAPREGLGEGPRAPHCAVPGLIASQPVSKR